VKTSLQKPQREQSIVQEQTSEAVMNERNLIGRRLFGQWVRATWSGWALGVPLIIALALVGEAVGIGGAQFLVGIGVGMGIGIMQGRAIRNVIQQAVPWFWSCAIGLAVPFLVTDISKAIGRKLPYSLYVCVGAGGLIVGVWQAILLRSRLHKTGWWWVVASVLGWTLAGVTAAMADSLSRSHSFRGIWGAIAYLGIVAMGGLVLGLITGISLVWMLRHKSAV
jgi:hypothetical protein